MQEANNQIDIVDFLGDYYVSVVSKHMNEGHRQEKNASIVFPLKKVPSKKDVFSAVQKFALQNPDYEVNDFFIVGNDNVSHLYKKSSLGDIINANASLLFDKMTKEGGVFPISSSSGLIKNIPMYRFINSLHAQIVRQETVHPFHYEKKRHAPLGLYLTNNDAILRVADYCLMSGGGDKEFSFDEFILKDKKVISPSANNEDRYFALPLVRSTLEQVGTTRKGVGEENFMKDFYK